MAKRKKNTSVRITFGLEKINVVEHRFFIPPNFSKKSNAGFYFSFGPTVSLFSEKEIIRVAISYRLKQGDTELFNLIV